MNRNIILTITGSDGTGGSGLQADIGTISSLGGYAVSVVTTITVQNTIGIQQFFDIPANIVRSQIDAIINDVQPAIIKIGMVRSVSVIDVIAGALQKYRPQHVVFDPVVLSSRKELLMPERVIEHACKVLAPISDVVVVRGGDRHVINDIGSAKCYVLDENAMHGFAGSFASAVAFFLSQHDDVDKALERAETYIHDKVESHKEITGRGNLLYKEFLGLVSSHCAERSDVAYYADCLNVSGRYLAQICKKNDDKTPKAIIDSVLLRHLTDELSSTSKTVQEIAFGNGFSSQAHMTKFFKKKTGVTPTQYRDDLGHTE